jgi:hypothetical protein
MPEQLFPLRGVPDDEAEDIRALLADNNIEFYETSAGNWGTSLPAIWLRDDSQLERARTLIDAYQSKRTLQQREIYAQLKREGRHRTFWTLLRETPLKIVAYLGAVLVILYLSIRPYLALGF